MTQVHARLFSRVLTRRIYANGRSREIYILSLRPSITFSPTCSPPRALVRQNTNYLHCEITPRGRADARQCIIPRRDGV